MSGKDKKDFFINNQRLNSFRYQKNKEIASKNSELSYALRGINPLENLGQHDYEQDKVQQQEGDAQDQLNNDNINQVNQDQVHSQHEQQEGDAQDQLNNDNINQVNQDQEQQVHSQHQQQEGDAQDQLNNDNINQVNQDQVQQVHSQHEQQDCTLNHISRQITGILEESGIKHLDDSTVKSLQDFFKKIRHLEAQKNTGSNYQKEILTQEEEEQEEQEVSEKSQAQLEQQEARKEQIEAKLQKKIKKDKEQ